VENAATIRHERAETAGGSKRFSDIPGIPPLMELEEGMRRKIVVSVVAVSVFIGLILGIGATFNSGGLGSTGGLALVGSVVLFILVMAGAGVFLDR
jgi:multisubunit Na+/H+ antiporter MnhB subunit